MEHMELYEAIFKRRSVRRYAGPIDEGTMEEVESFARSLKPLHPGIRTELRVLNDDGVRGPFKVSAPHFLAIYSEEADGHAANAGFMLQQMDLFLSSRGIGSCWQGGPRPTGDAKKVSGLGFVISLAFGVPGEDVHRRSTAEFKRKPLEDITDIGGMNDILEAARLAPSGMNRQSWYFTGGGDVIRVHYARSMLTDQMNRVNAGIALCHLWLAALHEGSAAELVREEGQDAPRGFSYVASVMLK
ncbi:hypothetical protein AOA80_07195 [Methanomassiliicoccales archaeon RumEn M1]|jgi:nitroreductase|nr:hypothetical protein AOA80_07195 [Methanomassiliicoccales archaeon RumEn M1]